MKEPTIEEVLELVDFERNACGDLYIKNVNRSVWGNVWGCVEGDVKSHVKGAVYGNVNGFVGGYVGGGVAGTIDGREWKFLETDREKVIRLIREGKNREAIQVLEESE